MEPTKDFRSLIDGLIAKSEAAAAIAEREEQRRAEAFHAQLVTFDKEADRVQAEFFKPRIDYLAAQFPNTITPEYAEGENYRHRIHLLFTHSNEFPCTGDVKVVIMHDPEPGHFSVSFDYVILPTYVTDHYRDSRTEQFPMDGSADAALCRFIDDAIANFLTHYLKARA